MRDTRAFHARMRAAAEAFRLAGGRNPRVRVEGEVIEIIEAGVNSTDSDEAARTQAKFRASLGDAK